MGVVTSLFARKMIAAAGPGVDQGHFLASVGLDPDSGNDPKKMLVDSVYYDLLERLSEVIDMTDLGLRAGESMRLDEYGALGLAWKAAPTLRGSYARVERFARLWTSVVEYELRPTDRGDAVHPAPGGRAAAGTAAVERGDARKRGLPQPAGLAGSLRPAGGAPDASAAPDAGMPRTLFRLPGPFRIGTRRAPRIAGRPRRGPTSSATRGSPGSSTAIWRASCARSPTRPRSKPSPRT
jgi:hypothetical protein